MEEAMSAFNTFITYVIVFVLGAAAGVFVQAVFGVPSQKREVVVAKYEIQPIFRRFTLQEIEQPETTTKLAREGLRITGMTSIVEDGKTMYVLVSLEK